MTEEKKEEKRFKFSDTLKYVDDYKNEVYVDKKGKTKERAVYIGPIIRVMSDEKYSLRISIIATILAVFTFILLIRAVSLPYSGWFFSMITLSAALLPALFMVEGCTRLPFKDRKLKRDRYMKGIIRCFRSAAGVAVLLVVTLIAELISRMINSDWYFFSGEVLYLAYIVLSVSFSVVFIFLLRRLEVDERELYLKKNS